MRTVSDSKEMIKKSVPGNLLPKQAEIKEQAGRSFSDRLLVEYLYLLLARIFQVTAEAEEQVKGKEK
jgi:hypothetical protein